MRELLQQRAELEKQLDELIRTTDHSSSEDRSKMIEESQPVLSRMKEIERVLGRQRAKLGELIRDVLAEVGFLAGIGSYQRILELLNAVGDLPYQMFDQQGFEWDRLRDRFQAYQQRYQARYDYVKMVDEIRSSG